MSHLAAAVVARIAAVNALLRYLSVGYFVGFAHFTLGTGWKKASIQKHLRGDCKRKERYQQWLH
jgi:hypothetical protein